MEAAVWVLIGVVISGMLGFVLDARSSRRHIESRIDGLGGKIDAQGASLGARIDALGAELRSEMATLGSDLRSEMATLGSDLRSEMATLGAEVHHMAGQMEVLVSHDHTHTGVSS
ncbi:MAG: hypothetical protein ACYCST_10120 [Acidimicrobiales bacterium]